MNKTHVVRDQAGASTSLYYKEHIGSPNNRQSSLAIPSFLRWFKKNERNYRKSSQNLNNCNYNKNNLEKNEHQQEKESNSRYSTNNLSNYNSHETLSPSSSPILGYLSPSSSSCDSLFSTSTTGFAFIKPNNYKPYGNAEVPESLIASGPETDTYRKRLTDEQNSREIDKRLELTLRTKYCLYDIDTNDLNNDNSGYDNIKFYDRSLPHIRNKETIENDKHISDYSSSTTNSVQSRIDRRYHRRAISDSSKDKKSGAYVHVKGKRKAPQPPLTNGSIENNVYKSFELYQRSKNLNNSNRNISETISIGSTLGRKKRKAPQPPKIVSASKSSIEDNVKSILSDGLLNAKEIKAIIENRISSPRYSSYSDIDIMKGTSNKRSQTPPENNAAARKLTDQQKQLLIDNVIKTQVSTTSSSTNNLITETEISNKMDTPISPRPWYKRPISTNRDSLIPFKREVVLKTMEKRKTKQKDTKSNISNGSQPSESGHSSRSSIFEAFFMRNKDNSSDKEKRKSGIGIPNISELDREAAEIVSKENANVKAKQQAEDEKFFNPPEHLILQQQMFGSSNNIEQIQSSDCDDQEKITSTKDLITKFEASSQISRITLNTSFIGRKDNFFNNREKNDSTIAQQAGSSYMKSSSELEVEDIFKNIGLKPDCAPEELSNDEPQIKSSGNNLTTSNLKEDSSKQDDRNNITKISWSCPYCTLENPNWRIICEICERIKPYDKKGNVDESVIIRRDIRKPEKTLSLEENNETTQTDTKTNNKIEENLNWEKKTEKVKKYFGNGLSKSSSESTVNKKLPLTRKSASPSKIPIGSPKFDLRNSRLQSIDLIKSQELDKLANEKGSNSSNLDSKEPLIDSSAIITTVTPVFYATTTVFKAPESISNSSSKKTGESIDLTEVRNARLAKFSSILASSPPQTEEISTRREDLSDHDSLEREKKRLREVIRAMNAKALADKYSVLQKSASLDESCTSTECKNELTNDIIRRSPEPGTKLGAIRKVFTRTRSPDSKKTNLIPLQSLKEENPEDYYTKPKKVSASAQTAGLKEVKKPEIYSEKKLSSSAMYANSNIKTYELIAPREFTERKIAKINSNVYVNVPQLGDASHVFNSDENIPRHYSNQSSKLSEFDQAKVEEISQQLQSVEGINDFKATIRNPTKGLSRTDTLALNKIMRNLEMAISEGKHELAAKIAVDLAKMKVSLHVTKQKIRPASSGNQEFDKNIIVDLYVEDKISHKGPIQIPIKPLLTITELKEKIFKDFEIPKSVQRWLINDELVTDDNKTLLQYGVKDSSATFYLYLVAAETKPQEAKVLNSMQLPSTSRAIPEDLDENDRYSSDSLNDDDNSDGAVALPIAKTTGLVKETSFMTQSTSEGWSCPLCTLINHPERLACSACTKARPANYIPPAKKNINFINNTPEMINNKIALSEELQRFLGFEKVQYRPVEKRNDLNKSSPNRKSSEIFNIIIKDNEKLSPIRDLVTSAAPISGIDDTSKAGNFSSPNITKSKYRGVYNFNPNQKDKNSKTDANSPVAVKAPSRKKTEIKTPIKKVPEPQRAEDIDESTDNEKHTQETLKIRRFEFRTSQHYLELLNLDNSDVVPNVEPFECPVCFMKSKTGEGVILRDCLHTFCKECLINTVQYSEEAQVKCPYMDADYSCDSIIQEREVKALVPNNIYELHLAKSVRVAECQIENTFHCKTPNCRGWCIYEDNVNQFKCPVCRITNCLTCRVIHDGLTCKQYQDRLNSDCDSNLDARRTKEMLKEMVDKGEAMNCPTCQVIMMKKWGCDWLKCSMCKTEVCWVTRGPRWGPAGKGDTSAGCKCGVDGKKCHPKCNYCH